MSSIRQIVSGLLGVAIACTVSEAGAQGNLDAGKSPAQIFSNTCSACHRSPRELKRASESFLRSHYTTGREEAAAMAGYLGSVGSDPNAGQSKRGPPDNPKNSRREPPPSTPDAQSARRPPAQGEPKAGESKAQGRNAAASKRGRNSAEVGRPVEPETPPEPAAEPPSPPPKPALETFEE